MATYSALERIIVAREHCPIAGLDYVIVIFDACMRPTEIIGARILQERSDAFAVVLYLRKCGVFLMAIYM